MLRALPGKYASLDALSDATVPDAIKLKAVRPRARAGSAALRARLAATRPVLLLPPQPLDVFEPLSETEALAALRAMAGANIVAKSFYGCGCGGGDARAHARSPRATRGFI